MRPTDTSKGSIHISYNLPTRPYHKIISALVEKYAEDGAFVLDIGCGTGNTLKLISDQGRNYKMYGADIDKQCLDITQQSVNLEQTIHFEDILEVESFNLPQLDIIVCSHVLEHVTRPYDAARVMHRMLKPGGIMILAVPNPVRLDVILLNLFRKFERVNKGHVQTWDRAHWKNFLENILEFSVIEYPTDFILVPKLDKFKSIHPVLIFMAKVFPGFARSCMAVVHKPK